MQTLELKLKKDVLIVEIPRLADYEFINKECKYLKIGNEEIKLNASTLDKFEFLCKGSELTEEIASELVEQSYSNLEESIMYRDYMAKYDDEVLYEALKSFKSAIESKGFYWLENPISLERVISYESVGDTFKSNGIKKVWQEAEEKTFKNPLIFIKNYVQ